MSSVGQIEKETQARVVALFQEALQYDYLGDWTDRLDNANIEPTLLRPWLQSRGVDDALITRALQRLDRAANQVGASLYDRNHAVFDLLRYGVKVKGDVGDATKTVWLIDWENPAANHFAIAEEVTVDGIDPKAHQKRPDIVIYVNGIALGVLELKRSTVSVAEGIRQNLDNQKKEFIQPFFATMQWVMAGNDTEGLRYGTIETKEKHYLSWKEDGPDENPLDRALKQVCRKERLLELMHDFVVFDAGTKKLCRHNQYFGVRAAQASVLKHQGGIIWHTQGSGKSLTMVWLARWIREHMTDGRVLLITDRTELDDQIEKVFQGVGETIHRTKSGADLVDRLNRSEDWLLCSLVHKFGAREDGESGDIPGYIADLMKALPEGFKAKGDLFVFVDECHRTQSGELHKAMKAILPGATFLGFTGTPLLRADKQRSIEVFGPYIHTYKFDEAVRDGVVVDLRYEARDIDQRIASPQKIDQWFEAATKGLNDVARAQLKARWGTMQKVLSCQDRLGKIVADILLDMETRDRLKSGHGNALLVSGSIYQACRFYELFQQTPLKGKCAIVTSYAPNVADQKGEDAGEGVNERLRQYQIYRDMLADWFDEPPEKAVTRVEEFEKQAKKRFVEQPGQLKLLIVVDKLLTGFDAPSATYLYIDKQMRDHGLFQAICRVNRLDGEDKEYGYVIDYKDLFKSLEGAVKDYTSGALDGYDPADVAGLLQDRLKKARERLEETREAVKALCEPVEAPRGTEEYVRYFCSSIEGDVAQLKANEPNRLALYRHVAAFVRAYANLANEMIEAGFKPSEIATIRQEVEHYEKVREEVKLASADYIDLKAYEPAMRHLIDSYVRAEDSVKVSAFDDLSLIELIVQRGPDVVKDLPGGLANPKTAAEAIVNNVRKRIMDEHPVNPKYYEQMSKLLDALVIQRRKDALDYQEYLKKLAELAKKVVHPGTGSDYPTGLDTPGKRALFDNLGRDQSLALAVHEGVRESRQDDWRGNPFKVKKVKNAIRHVLEGQVGDVGGEPLEERVERVLDLVKNQHEY